MKRWWFGPREYRDEKRIALKQKALRDLFELLEEENENGYVDYIKLLMPEVTPDKLQECIKLFRDEIQKKRALSP